MIRYGFRKELDRPYEEVVTKVTETLKKEGFGVLTQIDIRDKMKEKLGVDFPPYVILGACSPPNAYRALQAEPDIGFMLPCNAIVYEAGGKTVLAFIKPSVATADDRERIPGKNGHRGGRAPEEGLRRRRLTRYESTASNPLS